MTRYKLATYGLCFGLGLITHAWLGAQYTNSIEPALNQSYQAMEVPHFLVVDETRNGDDKTALDVCLTNNWCMDIMYYSDLTQAANLPTREARARYEHCSHEHEAGTDIYFECLTGNEF